MADPVAVTMTVNGVRRVTVVEPRVSLADMLRQDMRLTGVHLGCEHGVCGACNVIVDGRSTRACLMLAVQAEGAEIVTVEGAENLEVLEVLKDCFRDRFALQCGFCTPGMMMTAIDLLTTVPDPDEETVRDYLSGNICRCTGYLPIIAAVLDAARILRDRRGEAP